MRTRVDGRGVVDLACAVVALAGMLSPGVGRNGRNGPGTAAVCAWRCSGRCGWSSTARPSRCPGPSAARCSRSSRSPRAGPSAWTAWWTPCGRRRCRTPGGRPCTPTSPGCARTSDRRRAGCRPATTATGSTSPPTSSTSRRRGPCSRRPAPPRPTPCAVLQEAHGLWRGPVLADLTDVEPIAVAVAGCAQLHRERDRRPDLLCRRRGPGRRRRRARRRRARRRPVARTGGAPADARARRDRAGRPRRCGSAGSTGDGWPTRRVSTRRPRWPSGNATSPAAERPARPTAPARPPASSAARRRSRRCTGCWERSGG